jgi:hypothetical protein
MQMLAIAMTSTNSFWKFVYIFDFRTTSINQKRPLYGGRFVVIAGFPPSRE